MLKNLIKREFQLNGADIDHQNNETETGFFKQHLIIHIFCQYLSSEIRVDFLSNRKNGTARSKASNNAVT